MSRQTPFFKTPLFALVVLLGSLGAAGGFWLSQQHFGAQGMQLQRATLLNPPRALGPFSLLDHNNQRFGPEQLQGKWSFVFFGYTHCPDVCPTALTMLNAVALDLEKDGPAKNVRDEARFLFVTVDPERDTVEQLSKYVPYFNKSFVGLTEADKGGILSLTAQLGIPYMKVPVKGDEQNYQVDHSSSILLFNPNGHLQALFSAPHDAAVLSGDFRILRKYLEFPS